MLLSKESGTLVPLFFRGAKRGRWHVCHRICWPGSAASPQGEGVELVAVEVGGHRPQAGGAPRPRPRAEGREPRGLRDRSRGRRACCWTPTTRSPERSPSRCRPRASIVSSTTTRTSFGSPGTAVRVRMRPGWPAPRVIDGTLEGRGRRLRPRARRRRACPPSCPRARCSTRGWRLRARGGRRTRSTGKEAGDEDGTRAP